MKFENEDGKEEWYEGTIVSHNGQTRKYSVYFLCYKQTIETYLDDEDVEIC